MQRDHVDQDRTSGGYEGPEEDDSWRLREERGLTNFLVEWNDGYRVVHWFPYSYEGDSFISRCYFAPEEGSGEFYLNEVLPQMKKQYLKIGSILK